MKVDVTLSTVKKPVNKVSLTEMCKKDGVYVPEGSCHSGSRVVISGKIRLYLDENTCELLNMSSWTRYKFTLADEPVSITFKN